MSGFTAPGGGKVEGLGAPGTPAGAALTVQGSAAGTPIPVSQPGLSGGILTTWTAVLTTATPNPAAPLAGRATLLVQAWEGNALPILITGTGYVGATTGDGNADVYVAVDTVHPSAAGSAYLGTRLAFAIRPPNTGLVG